VSIERAGRPDPIRTPSLAGAVEERRGRSALLGAGTLACPRCDVPVALGGPVAPADPLDCPYCGHYGAVRDFLSLAAPTRPAHVEVRVVIR
jgi:hypothetical protein